ncbi:MAG: prepilin-type N-terminal cleavage/methylation domain-containing protein [Nitrospiraceae bacterium]|nr:MAG: prepilin-type N-terminal cleavage/methylation domain-containing protein [Nitrospiraceae bacterium]
MLNLTTSIISNLIFQILNFKFQKDLPPTPYSLAPCPSRRAGFTLLEILVALSITGIALIVVLQLFSANLKNISVSEDYVFAVSKAEARMRELLEGQNLQEGSWRETTADGYRVDIAIKNSQKERTQNLKVSLMEIDLTIHWTNAAKERSFTLKSAKLVKKRV